MEKSAYQRPRMGQPVNIALQYQGQFALHYWHYVPPVSAFAQSTSPDGRFLPNWRGWFYAARAFFGSHNQQGAIDGSGGLDWLCANKISGQSASAPGMGGDAGADN